ncbi:hypothetical protein E2C01_074913 [Portunus trituberculatus]|uniref:Uncharacterized protein n=1 Tax=Portunus trituberculatus TaxID=210409 RepID=A0A5B7IDM6_PORTR|nr:hypothetical protein [Portunus trituberculatus]
MMTVGGRGGRAWKAWRACMGVCVILWALSPLVISAGYYKVYMDSKGPISLCLPLRVYLPDTRLTLPNAYCAYICDTHTTIGCNAFWYSSKERIFLCSSCKW